VKFAFFSDLNTTDKLKDTGSFFFFLLLILIIHKQDFQSLLFDFLFLLLLPLRKKKWSIFPVVDHLWIPDLDTTPFFLKEAKKKNRENEMRITFRCCNYIHFIIITSISNRYTHQHTLASFLLFKPIFYLCNWFPNYMLHRGTFFLFIFLHQKYEPI
jgi:hypothetical protein